MPSQLEEVDKHQWFGVRDLKERKRIQDKLAQRARRKRLSEKAMVSTSSHQAIYPTFEISELSPESSREQSSQSSPRASDTSSSTSSIGSDHRLLPRPSLTVYSALFTNGLILGIPCATTLAEKSRPASTRVPEPLQPLPIQLAVVHFQFIDRFPILSVRYNAILFIENFNAEEFLSDLFTIPSFEIKPNSPSWDPAGWVIDSAFKKKWAFLFHSHELHN